jgi:UDP-glucose 6-dehydrogenase
MIRMKRQALRRREKRLKPGTREDLEAKKWGGDGHITSPSFLRQGRAHDDQESSTRIIS